LIIVGQQRVRPALCFRSGSDELGLADCGSRLLWFYVRIIEESEDEFLAQQSAYRYINPILADPALLYELHYKLGPRLAA
jgi:hypothetical protein